MDHRNADGSHAEMCGNGIRLFLHVLVSEGLLDRATCEAGVLVGTRGGPRRVGATPDGGATGSTWARPGRSARGRRGCRGRSSPGLAVSMGNPHLACLTDVDLDTLDLDRRARRSTPALFPEGVNIELDHACSTRARTSGCGCTSAGWGRPGPAAPAPAPPPTRHWSRDGRTEGTVVVDVPGGRLRVRVGERTTVLTGPAVLVSAGVLCAEWLAG